MSLLFSVPGKSFIAGEYLALLGGPSLVFLSQPCFEFKVSRGSGSWKDLHPESPAGKFIHKYQDFFEKYDIEFSDPYAGKGGFGASTAQFLGAYVFWLRKETPNQDMESLVDFKHLLHAYYEVAWSGVGQKPSGADLIGQLKGSLTFFDKGQGLISVKKWPFADLEIQLIHTGNKIATHQHLQSLGSFEGMLLEKSFQQIKDSFDKQDGFIFVEGIRSYGAALKELGFVCDETLVHLEQMHKLRGVVAAKGCGALGADVIVAVTELGQEDELREYCRARGLAITCNSKNISSGLQVQGAL